jgi:hypothetical protein
MYEIGFYGAFIIIFFLPKLSKILQLYKFGFGPDRFLHFCPFPFDDKQSSREK